MCVRFTKNMSCYIGLSSYDEILIYLKKFMINLNHFNSFKFLLQKFELFEGLVGINEVRFSKNISCYIGLNSYDEITHT